MAEEEKKAKAVRLWKGKKPGKDQFVICILAGILLLVIAMPTSKSDGKMEEVKKGETAVVIEKLSTSGQQPEEKQEGIKNAEEYERYMENKLEQAIAAMEGAGRVKVMVTAASSQELVLAQDVPTNRNITSEEDAQGGVRRIEESEEGEETVYKKDGDGNTTPYVIKTLQPLIKGVVVVAQGGNHPQVSKNITEAIVALFDIEPHKIKVVKMKSE
ncbi:MAG: stage III sporulation protein AG [Lachnospiraceae bacterium]|nr:stage III sporulation protein AG [Lachnospiraceae bacterium]